ncbi:MAG: TonB-dependent receptor [Bacteroidetes bacterium]|nr:TonB-dependent receptor [Bacteroidota bacterium]
MEKKLPLFLLLNPAAKAVLLVIIFLGASFFAIAQELHLKGVVRTESGATLPGVNVVIKGTTTGTSTGGDGSFSISAGSDKVLVFSFLGYTKQEIEIKGRSVIDVVLQESSRNLDEVVVVGYGTQRKSDLTGAVSSVKADDMERMPSATTDQALQGRAAGVTITSNSGSPGSPFQVRVRGVGTINDASPLFVVDGFPVDDISYINPADIASLEILKDASATAIYGSRGANGVILITTRNGKAGTPVVTFDTYLGTSSMWKKPELLDASQWAMLKNEALTNAGLDPLPELANYQSLGKGTDWVKEVTQSAATRNLNFSLSGGSNMFTYFLSANNYKQEGIVKKSDFERTSVRLNTNLTVKNWLKFGENLSLESGKNHRINEDDEWSAILIQAVAIDPVTKVYQPDGNFAPSNYVDMNNPVAHIDRTHNEAKNFRVTGNVFGDIILFKDLVFKSNLGLNYNFGNDYDYSPTYFISGSESNDVSAVYRGSSQDRSWSWSNFFTYTKKIKLHDLQLMAGMEASQDYSEWFSTRATKLLKEFSHLIYISNATNPNSTSSGLMNDKRIFSYFGRLNYTFNNKYLLTANIRRDGSSVFGPDHRFGVFPSFSAGWRINQENFMKDVSFISNLKLRAGWGQIGNDKIPPYGYSTLATSGKRYSFGGVIQDGISFPGMGNPDMHWETTTTTNIGVDAGFWQDKLTLVLEYYIKKTSDMLLDAPILAHVGIQENPWVNIGGMKNNGFEAELNFTDEWNKLHYNIGFNFSTYTNEVTDLGTQASILSAPLRDNGFVTRTMVGYPIAQFWGYKTDGLFQNQAEVDAWVDPDGNPLQPNAGPGDIRYAKDQNGNLYYGVIGNPLPDFTLGMNLNLEYRGFDLTLFVQGVYGNDVFNGTKVYTDRPDASHNMSVRMLNRWTVEGSTNDAHFPRLNAADANNLAFSDRYVEKGSYTRVKNLQIGYTLPQELSNTLKIVKLRFYVGATNLLTFTKYDGFDPEIGTGYFGSLDLGVDRAFYPQPRTFVAGLNLTF